MYRFYRNIMIIALVVVCFAVSGAQAGDQSGVQDTNDEVRFLKWYILLSDTVSAKRAAMYNAVMDANVVFLLSNVYGSPTADGHYEGTSCVSLNTDMSTMKIANVKTTGYIFSTSHAPNCSIELVPDPLNTGKLTAEFSINYTGRIESDITASAYGQTHQAAGGTSDAEPFGFKMIVDLFKGTDKGGNKVTVYFADEGMTEYAGIPLYGYLFSSDELSQEEFDEYVDKLNERMEKEKSAKSPQEQRIEAVQAQLETAKRNLERAQELAANATAAGRTEDAVRHADDIDRERARIEQLVEELDSLGASPK